MVRGRSGYPNKILHIICEGKTEYSYFANLQQFLFSNGLHNNRRIIPYEPEKAKKKGEHRTDPNNLLKQAIRIKKKEAEGTDLVFIALDKDVFTNGTYNEMAFIRGCNSNGIIPIFNTQNMEDFLITHLGDNKIAEWETIVKSYATTMTSEQVKEEIIKIIPKYKKGSVSDLDIVTKEKLKNTMNYHNSPKATRNFDSEIVSKIFKEYNLPLLLN